jgi:GNAT superfamily N-acetyltransferase
VSETPRGQSARATRNREDHPFVQSLVRRLEKIGIEAIPFLLVEENVVPPPDVAAEASFEFRRVDAGDTPALMRLEPRGRPDFYEARLAAGKLGFALFDGERAAAMVWADPDEINSDLWPTPLDDGEVYLYNAYSHPDYRGRNLAPYLRLRCYQALEALGFRRFVSISEYTNDSARRFKAKLGAVNRWLGLRVRIGERAWRWR